MSNTRYVSYYGKTTTGGSTTFGLTVQSGGATPNIIQTTYEPAAVNGSPALIQNQQFIMNYNNNSGPIAVGTLSNIIVANSTLVSGRTYQFTANLTIVIQDVAGTYYSGNYSLQAGARDTTLIGSGFTLSSISKDTGFNSFLPDANINIAISSSKFSISITTIAGITTSIDTFANISISSVEYNA